MPSRKIPLPQQTNRPLFPRDASQEGSHAHPFLLAFPGMGVWTNSEVQMCVSLCPRERQSAPFASESQSAEPSHRPPVFCVTVCCVCARVFVCSLASVPVAQRKPEGGLWALSGSGRGCLGKRGAGAAARPAPGAGPSEPRALQWDVFSFKS